MSGYNNRGGGNYPDMSSGPPGGYPPNFSGGSDGYQTDSESYSRGSTSFSANGGNMNGGGGNFSGGNNSGFPGTISYPPSVTGGFSGTYNGGGGENNDRMMLQEQKKINAELMDEMKHMQMQIRMMTSNMMNMNSNGGMMGNGNMAAFSTNMWNSNQGFGGFNNMGQGYRDESGGGKMGGGMAGNRSMPYNMRVPKQPGDWDCPVCGNMNFSRRNKCNGKDGDCGEMKKPEYVRVGVAGEQRSGGRKGDWDCAKCANLNYAYRDKCNKCGISKAEGCRSVTGEVRSSMIKFNGDWYCPMCNNMNFSYRTSCNKKDCNFEKKDLPPDGGMAPMNAMAAAMWNNGNGGMGAKRGGGGGVGGRSEKTMLRRHKGPEPREGDWECPRCYNLNFVSRDICNGTRNEEACKLMKPEFAKYGVKPWKYASNIKEWDWDCWGCGNVNFSARDACNKCSTSKAEAQRESLRVLDASEADRKGTKAGRNGDGDGAAASNTD